MVDFAAMLAITPEDRNAKADAVETRIAADEMRARTAAATTTICVQVVDAGTYRTLPDGTRLFQFVCMDVHKSEPNIRAAFALYSSHILDTAEQRTSMEADFELDEILNIAGHYVTRRWKSRDSWMNAQIFMVDIIDAPRPDSGILPEKPSF